MLNSFVRYIFVFVLFSLALGSRAALAYNDIRDTCGDGAHLYQEGVASWYGHDFHRLRTASGERYDMYDFTIAHKTLIKEVSSEKVVWVCVKNKANGKTVMARVNDAGPYVKGRVADLSFAAAHAIDLDKSGVANVELYVYN